MHSKTYSCYTKYGAQEHNSPFIPSYDVAIGGHAIKIMGIGVEDFDISILDKTQKKGTKKKR